MSGNDTCLGETVPQSSNEQVLWTTVLFALVGSGVNTMLQPAGAVCDGEPSLGPMLRSSPIVCIIDACYLLYRLMYFYFDIDNKKHEKRSLQRAHLRLLRQRYQPWVEEAKPSDRSGENEAGHGGAGQDASNDKSEVVNSAESTVDHEARDTEAENDEAGSDAIESNRVVNDGTGNDEPNADIPSDVQPDNVQPDNVQPDNVQPDNVQPDNAKSNNLKPNEGEARVFNLFGLLQTLAFRLFTFGLMMIAMVKFFAFSGLIWSKIVISLYLVPLIIVEFASTWSAKTTDEAKEYTGDREALASSGFASLSYISVALAVAFLSYFGASALRDAFEGPHGQFGQYLTLFTFSSWIIPFISVHFFCLYDNLDWYDWNSTILPSILLLAMVCMPWSYWAFSAHITATFKHDVWIQTACIGLVTAWVLIGAKYAAAVTDRVREIARTSDNPDQRRMIKRRKVIELFLAWWFVVLHLVTVVLYLMFSYETAGTSKPGWTKWLD